MLEQFNEWLIYHESGALLWRKSPNRRVRVGSIAGAVCRKPGYVYLAVKLDGRSYKAHRIVWAMHYGDPGEYQIDHINRDSTDNRIENLRLATPSQNQENRECRGTHFCNTRRRWIAKIRVRGVSRTLGQYATEAEAHEVYLATKRAEHEFCTI